MAVDLRGLRAFVTVVDEGTFTDAAIALRTSQASVSRAVAALEQALGARVVQRTPRGVALTTAGRKVLPHARRVLDEVGALERAAGSGDAELRVGYAWAALGRHTGTVQRRWAAEHPGSTLVFVPANTATAGLAEGDADVGVVRRPVDRRRFQAELVGVERRYAAVPDEHPLARRRTVRLRDFAGTTVAVDSRTGSTTADLWSPEEAPAAMHETQGVEDWLMSIAAGRALGMTSEATAQQHPRPGVTYRPVRDAPPVPVWLAWGRDDPPAAAAALVLLVAEVYCT